jgi:CIC family chloride channel protein
MCAASGIAAAYNAPISGAVFAALVVLGNFSMAMFAPLVFASVVATMVCRSFFQIFPSYDVTPFYFTRLTQLPWFLILGALAGCLGAVFLKLLGVAEELFKRLPWPIYLRLALGDWQSEPWHSWFPAFGETAIRLPTAFCTSSSAPIPTPLDSCLVLLLAKLAATLATVGSGAVGGVFTPTLFLGSGLGAFFRAGDPLLLPRVADPVAYLRTGWDGQHAFGHHALPLLAMIMIMEIARGDYSLMPALMIGCVVSMLVARKLHPASIYTEPLRRKGLIVSQDAITSEAATERVVSDLMRAPVSPVRETATLTEVADRFFNQRE